MQHQMLKLDKIAPKEHAELEKIVIRELLFVNCVKEHILAMQLCILMLKINIRGKNKNCNLHKNKNNKNKIKSKNQKIKFNNNSICSLDNKILINKINKRELMQIPLLFSN